MKTLYFGSLTVTFDGELDRVGFVFGGNTDNTVPFDVLRGGGVTGSFTLTSFDVAADGVNNWIFYGFEDLAGIDEIRFNPESSSGWFVGIYDLTTEASASVPEPASLALLGLGLAGLGFSRRKSA